MSYRLRPDESVEGWGQPDSEGNPMTSLSDLMTSQSHVSNEQARGGVPGMLGRAPDGSLVLHDDSLLDRRKRWGSRRGNL